MPIASTMKSANTFERHSILITLSLVVVLGIPAGLSIVSIPQKIDGDPGLMSAGREPASVRLVNDKNGASPLTKSASKDINCDSDLNLGALGGSHLRLKGANCGEITELAIRNTTNGFTASAIPLKGGQFTSDFIDLSEGNNLIEISKVNALGEKTIQTIHVQRTPASDVSSVDTQ